MMGEIGMSLRCGQAIPEKSMGRCWGYEPTELASGGRFHSMHCYTALMLFEL